MRRETEGGRRTGLTIERLLFPILLLLALVSSQISAAYIVFGFLAAGWFLTCGSRRALTERFSSPLVALAGVYVLLVLLSVVFSRDPGRSLKGAPGLVILFLLPIAMDLTGRVAQARALLLSLAGGGVALALAGFWQFAHGGNEIHNRIRGSLSHYMTFSGLTMIAGCLLVAFLFEEKGRRRWVGALCVVPFAAMLLTFTRSAYVGALASLLLYLAIRRPRGLFVAPLLLLLVFLLVPSPVKARIASIADIRDETSRDRIEMARTGLRMIGDYPLFGLGPEMVKPYSTLYRGSDARRWRVGHLHSNLLQIAAASGLFTAAAYLGLLALFFARTVFLLRQEKRPDRAALFAGSFLAAAALTVAGFFEYNFGDTEVLIATLLVMAVPFSKALSGEQKRAGENPEALPLPAG